MNTPRIARNQGEDSRRSRCGIHDASEAAPAWHGRSRWRTTMFVRSIVAIVAITGALTLVGCLGGDDDSRNLDTETFPQGTILSDFRNVMPLVNDRGVVFLGGVMGAVGPATLSVTGFATCDDVDCTGNFNLAGDDGAEAEGDSGGEDSCFFLFQDDDIQPQGRQIDCNTCKLEVVEECVVIEAAQGTCRVRWFLDTQSDVAPENASTSEPFDVTLTIERGEVVAILAGGEKVTLVAEPQP